MEYFGKPRREDVQTVVSSVANPKRKGMEGGPIQRTPSIVRFIRLLHFHVAKAQGDAHPRPSHLCKNHMAEGRKEQTKIMVCDGEREVVDEQHTRTPLLG